MKKFLYLPIILLGFIYACNQQDEKKIISTIQAVYSTPNVYDRLGADTSVLSKQLSGLIARAMEVEELDLKRVRQSEYPTDKPLLIEGEIFTSVYEGYTSFKVEDTDIKENTARVVVRFKNGGYHLDWSDTLYLKNESAWKLDDVAYDKNGGRLQNTLKDFIASYKD